MATSIDAARRRLATRNPFYPLMALAIAGIVAAGFGPSYAHSLAPPGLPFWVHLHGAAMTLWILLFAAQSWLIRRRQLPLHRTLGWGSIALVALIVPLGIATDMLAVRRGATPPFFTPAGMMAADFADLSAFAALFAAALALRRRGDWHKRLLLSATVLLTYPAIGRIGLVQMFGLGMILPIAKVTTVALALAGPIHDLVRRGRVHPAYYWGVGAVILAHLIDAPIAASPPMQALAARLVAAG